MSFTVAIDGPAAAGKGTIGRALEAHFGFAYLDTGLLYRAIGKAMLDGADPVAAARALSPQSVAGAALRRSEVGAAASKVAAMPEVRAALVDFQRAFAGRSGGAVLDGRDIGTVICPDADVKLFVTASDAVRAERRWREHVAAGETIELGEVLANLRARDARDAERATSPMVPAADAVVLDTTTLSIEDALQTAVAEVERARR